MAKVKCSGCGERKFVNPQAMEARLKKYGSVEAIEKSWICRGCEKNGGNGSVAPKEGVAKKRALPENVRKSIVANIPTAEEVEVVEEIEAQDEFLN